MKEFVLNLDRPRKLIYDFDAWDKIAERYVGEDKETFDISKLNITYKEIPYLVHVGLLWEDSKITPEETKRMLNEIIRSGKSTIIDIMQTVTNAIFVQSGLSEIDLKKTITRAGIETEKKISKAALTIPGSKKK